MNKQKALMVAALFSLVGVSFSGYLTYSELILKTCLTGGCSVLFGLPTCAYGLVMYVIIFVASVTGLISRI